MPCLGRPKTKVIHFVGFGELFFRRPLPKTHPTGRFDHVLKRELVLLLGTDVLAAGGAWQQAIGPSGWEGHFEGGIWPWVA